MPATTADKGQRVGSGTAYFRVTEQENRKKLGRCCGWPRQGAIKQVVGNLFHTQTILVVAFDR
jgi:hypothetical protein